MPAGGEATGFTACGAIFMEAKSPDFGSAQLVPDGFDASKLTSTGGEQVHKNLFLKRPTTRSRTAETPKE